MAKTRLRLNRPLNKGMGARASLQNYVILLCKLFAKSDEEEEYVLKQRHRER